MGKNDCTTYLKNIVIRRNQIVHEGDYTDILMKRQDIYSQDIIDIREYILKLGKAIYDCVKWDGSFGSKNFNWYKNDSDYWIMWIINPLEIREK